MTTTIDAQVDTAKNRIYIWVQGFLTMEKALELKQVYSDAIGRCRPGFTVLSYVEEFAPGAPEIQEVIAQMKKMAAEAGIARVARVVGKKPLGGMQIHRLAHDDAPYPAELFENEEDAEAYLDEA